MVATIVFVIEHSTNPNHSPVEKLVYQGDASEARSNLIDYLDKTASRDYKENVLTWFDKLHKLESAILRNVPNGPGLFDEWVVRNY